MLEPMFAKHLIHFFLFVNFSSIKNIYTYTYVSVIVT